MAPPLLRSGDGALLNQRADFLRLFLKSGELRFEIFALQREGFLRILGLDELVSQIERRIHILLGVAENVRSDRFHLRLRGRGRAVYRADRFLCYRNKTFESLSSLIDATLRKIAQFIGNFKRWVGHAISLFFLFLGILNSLLLYRIAQSLLQCNIIWAPP